jgi:hypothetical protein
MECLSGNEIGRQCPILYYEHIIRDEFELNRIRKYVINNPAGWDKDEENPAMATRVAPTGNGQTTSVCPYQLPIIIDNGL